MAQLTKQDKAVGAALEVASMAAEIGDLLTRAKELSNRVTVNEYLSVLGTLPTAAWGADGSIGTTDGTPVSTHPITTQFLYLTSNDVTGGVYLINDFITFMTSDSSQPSAHDRTTDIAKLVR